MKRVLVMAGSGILLIHAAAISPEEIARHKQWMDEAQELKDEIRESVASGAAAAAAKLVGAAQKEVRFWKRAGERDTIELAERNLTAARQLLAASRAGDAQASQEAIRELEAGCRACHDLHPEKRWSR